MKREQQLLSAPPRFSLASRALYRPALTKRPMSMGSPASSARCTSRWSATPGHKSSSNVVMAYYHSFAWHLYEAPLKRVLEADPTCGMAHWAHALAILDNPFIWPGILSPKRLNDAQETLAAAGKTGLKSQRERDYVAALSVFLKDHDKVDHRTRAKALEGAMADVASRYPDDQEASILYALVLSANFDPTDRKYTNQLKAAAILEPIFKQQPEHPGIAHYLIHSYDYPPIAQHGLDAARRYARIAPDATHALHMPSHIFTRVGHWSESVEANRASAAAATDTTFDKLHAYDYMVYAHLQLGQDRAARAVIEEASKVPKLIDHFAFAYAFTAMPARVALERGDVERGGGSSALSGCGRLSLEQVSPIRGGERLRARHGRCHEQEPGGGATRR